MKNDHYFSFTSIRGTGIALESRFRSSYEISCLSAKRRRLETKVGPSIPSRSLRLLIALSHVQSVCESFCIDI